MVLNSIKFVLFLLFLLLLSIFYYNFLDVADCLFQKIDLYLSSYFDYNLGIQKGAMAFLKFLPVISIISLVIAPKYTKEKFLNLLKTIKWWQLIVYLLILPYLLLVQNSFYNKYLYEEVKN